MFDLDDLCWHRWTRVRNANAYLAATERCLADMPDMRFPFITFHRRAGSAAGAGGARSRVRRHQT